MDLAGAEAERLRNLLADIPLSMKPIPPVSLHCDCYVAIGRAINKTYNRKNRHIRLRHRNMRQLLNEGVISLEFVRSKRNLADLLSKPLSKRLVEVATREMGLCPLQRLTITVTQPM